MPSLDWIGKNKVINHHLDVPFKILEKQYTFNEENDFESENKIIHGDNLEALKALLPEYEGKIKCIYIDPPYNTGNEGWVYNDNVNDPKIKKWLGEVVGQEGEDLTRHDKWLCMMYPRLKLLQKLLSDDGAIFISIDDNEQANLKLICDEIFGSGNFVANISWQRTYSPRNDSKGVSFEVEHILGYSKSPNWKPNRLPRTEKMNSKYKNPDNDDTLWRTSDAFAPSAVTHQGMVYAIQHPFTGELIYPYKGACWPLQQEKMFAEISAWGEYEYKNLHDEEQRAAVCGISKDEVRKDVLSIVLKNDLKTSVEYAQKIFDKGKWPKFFFTNKGKGGIARKTYLDETDGRVVTNFWNYEEVGHTDFAKKEISLIFGDKVFDTPKPTRLIQRILQIATDKDSIILDSFAGSGTTAHAVLNMNKADGGNRKFILIEMMDYAQTITAERVKRVINDYGTDKNKVEGTGGNFSYYELGPRLLLENGFLNEEVSLEKIREYIWFTESGKKLQNALGIVGARSVEKQLAAFNGANSGTLDNPTAQAGTPENQYFLGNNHSSAYWFYYEKNKATTLDMEFLGTIKGKYEQYIIYADICLLPKEFMLKNNIIFKKIPRDIKKF